MADLLSMLLQTGVVTPERAVEARRHQVVFGDRIGTNLLALGFVTETTLAQALSALYGVPWAAGATADSRPTFTRTLPRQVAARLSAVPAGVDATGVTMFMLDPGDRAALAELTEHYRRPVQPVVVVEGRMWALLHKFYLVRRGMRALRLDGPEHKRTQLVSKATERRGVGNVSGEGAPASWLPSGPPLTPQTPLTPLTPTSSPPSPPSMVSVLPAPPVLPLPTSATSTAAASMAAALAGVDEDPPWLTPVGASVSRTVSARLAPAAEKPRFAEAEVSLDEFNAIEPAAALAGAGDESDHGHSIDDGDALLLGDIVDDDAGRERQPLAFDDAMALLRTVHDRNEIARIVLRYAMHRVRRALLLTVQRSDGEDIAMGWDALGESLPAGLAHDVSLSLTPPSVLRLAHQTRGHVLGPLPAGPINDALTTLLGGAPRTAFVMPILARERVVNLLYLDDGPGRFMPTDIGEVLILCQHINKSYDALLARG